MLRPCCPVTASGPCTDTSSSPARRCIDGSCRLCLSPALRSTCRKSITSTTLRLGGDRFVPAADARFVRDETIRFVAEIAFTAFRRVSGRLEVGALSSWLPAWSKRFAARMPDNADANDYGPLQREGSPSHHHHDRCAGSGWLSLGREMND